jgi:formate dehydrogenase subunit beta
MKAIQDKARELFDKGEIDALLAWKFDTTIDDVRPTLFKKGDDLSEVVFDERCVHNLANYLPTLVARYKKVGVVLKGCDGRSLATLLVEHRINRSQVVVLAPACDRVVVLGAKAQKCDDCPTNMSPVADHEFGERKTRDGAEYKALERIEKMTPEKRWQFFEEQFEKCQRCYACRQVCPMCYCEMCIADQQDPKWIEPSRKLSANTMWHLVRAYHLAGRCSDCGECQRACPEGIPMRLLNIAIEKLVKEEFGVKPGTVPDEMPPLVTLAKDDPDSIMGAEL